MQLHFFTADDGALHDTRMPRWERTPLRPNYKLHHTRINSVADLKATLRAGEYAWPGGYPMFLTMQDGATLHFKCVRDKFKWCCEALQLAKTYGIPDHSWQCVACEINYEDNDLHCDACNEPIECTYDNAEVRVI